MNWLFVTTEFPWPLVHGTHLRVYHLAKMLRKCGDEVSLLCPGGNIDGFRQYSLADVRVLDGPGEPMPLEAAAREEGSPYDFYPALAKSIRRQAGEYDAAVLFRSAAMQYAEDAAPAERVIVDMVDDPTLEERRALRQFRCPREILWRLKFLRAQPRYEAGFLSHVNATTFVSPSDAASFAARHPHARVECVPNGVDADYFAPSGEAAATDDRPPTVSFLGNLIHKPNDDAAMFLLRRVAPRLRNLVPGVRFRIIGPNPSPRLRRIAGEDVEITGLVDDVRPHLWESQVAIMPMRIGTGIKNKLLEAWAARVAVVATPHACQGIPASDGENLLLGRSAEQIACAAARLLEDSALRARIAGLGRQTVLRHFTWSAAAEKLRQTARSIPASAGRAISKAFAL